MKSGQAFITISTDSSTDVDWWCYLAILYCFLFLPMHKANHEGQGLSCRQYHCLEHLSGWTAEVAAVHPYSPCCCACQSTQQQGGRWGKVMSSGWWIFSTKRKWANPILVAQTVQRKAQHSMSFFLPLKSKVVGHKGFRIKRRCF